MWTDDEVESLLSTTLENKNKKTMDMNTFSCYVTVYQKSSVFHVYTDTVNLLSPKLLFARGQNVQTYRK